MMHHNSTVCNFQVPTFQQTHSLFQFKIKYIKYQIASKRCEVITCAGKPPTRQEILEMVKGVHGILWCSTHRLDEEVVNVAGPQLKVASTLSVGYDHIDASLLKRRNIKLGNTAGVADDSVAEVAVGLCLMAAHRLAEGRDFARASRMVHGNVDASWLLGHELRDATVGVVGLGRIGTEVARRLKAFKVCDIIYAGNQEKQEGRDLGATFVPLGELAERSDFIVVSCLLNDKTRHLINRHFFEKTKCSAILVNVARGEVIDQDALIEALNCGKIWGAGLDVTTPEPLPQGHPLLSAPRCVITAHQGNATIRTRGEMAILTARNILAALFDEEMPSRVV
ncbi:glyoxylate reductase/hydroxypyruvate reductase isoform X2 [Nilaparvata lugens]|uniref:glyoxylate reductase/hydroxypyruvate reductase isoform X2 n=1 Tax=Nilaparvata lugens TaxID=108931 RepID=UPI00193E8B37|nr:glyoxylate reductase/hydroxypyruvate reductase isoform X2 [Nilaparvata lugens]